MHKDPRSKTPTRGKERQVMDGENAEVGSRSSEKVHSGISHRSVGCRIFSARDAHLGDFLWGSLHARFTESDALATSYASVHQIEDP